jgi:hypothetical protein
MDRRDFLKTGAQAAVGLGIAGKLSINNENEPEPKPRPAPPAEKKHWVWSGTSRNASTQDLKAKYKLMKQRGLSGVYISGVDDREFDIIKEAGLEIHTWMWTTNRGDGWIRDNHPDWYMVSRSGKSCFDQPPYVGYYRWVSPVIPGVQNYLTEKVGELAAHPAVDGVHLDYVRYPDVILPDNLWETYGLDQSEELADYDFCYSEHTRAAFKKVSGRDPLDIKDPAHDQEWLHFRYDSVTNLVRKLAKESKSHGKMITAAVFPTPRLARKICRQNWADWPLDAACPMIYNSFYKEPAEWVGEMVLENTRGVTMPVYSGLYMPALSDLKDFRTAIDLTHKRGGAGVSLFGGVSEKHWKVFEEAISS